MVDINISAFMSMSGNPPPDFDLEKAPAASAWVERATARRVGRDCLCLNAQRAARAVARRFDAAFRPLGITSGQFSILVALTRPQPWRVAELAEALAMDRTTLTAALKPLERDGLTRAAADPKDKRARLLTLTEEGRALAARALPVWAGVQEALEAETPAKKATS